MATRTSPTAPAPAVADGHDLIRVAGRAREQPQGHQRRAAQAPADGVHRGVGVGQELAGVRDDRGRVAADDQRDLQRVRAGLHAQPRPPRRRPPRGPDDGDHRRPGADGGQPALHRRHRHRRQRDAAHPVQPARRPARRPAHGLLVQRPHPQGERGDVHRQGRPRREGRRQGRRLPRRHVPALRGHGARQRHRPHRALRRLQVAARGRPHGARATRWTAGTGGCSRAWACPWTSPSRRSPPSSSTRCSSRPRPRSRSRASTSPSRASSPRSRSRCCPRTPRRCSRTCGASSSGPSPSRPAPSATAPASPPRCGRRRSRGKNIAELCADADQRPRRVGARARRAVGGTAAQGAAAPARLVRPRSGWATSPSTGRPAPSRAARPSAPR